MGNDNNRSLNLKDAREHAPAVSAVEAMRRQLAMALFDAVKPQDIIDLARKLKEQAMAGDTKAAKLYLDLMLGKDPQAAPPPPNNSAANQVADAIRDLVDEIRISKASTAKVANDPKRLALPNGAHDDKD